jgi:hypothetical protein
MTAARPPSCFAASRSSAGLPRPARFQSPDPRLDGVFLFMEITGGVDE